MAVLTSLVLICNPKGWLECDYLDSTRSIIQVCTCISCFLAPRCRIGSSIQIDGQSSFMPNDLPSIHISMLVCPVCPHKLFFHGLKHVPHLSFSQGMVASEDAAGLKKLLGERLAFGTAGKHACMHVCEHPTADRCVFACMGAGYTYKQIAFTYAYIRMHTYMHTYIHIGLRGPMGAGYSRMNQVTVYQVSFGMMLLS
jgi:hypothetical protein